MPSYFPVTICRSDGQLKTIAKSNNKEELNQPTREQLDDTPDANKVVDCYRKLDPNDPKAIDWRRKLGGMLMHTVGGKAHADRNYILSELPEGYVLWEHVKYTVKSIQEQAEDKKRDKGKHAAGNYDRQDCYLYGHPQGRKKRFRSPADFFHHVLWLATDKEGDYRNCSCKICSPDAKKGEEEPEEVPIAIKKETRILPPTQSVSKPIPGPTPIQVRPVTGPIISTKSQEQKADGDPNSRYIYRPGEVVWFNNGANWRLGVIGKRGLLNDRPRYFIQPLSNPYQPQAPIIKDDETVLRPWLAWSVPETTIPQLKDYPFEAVPWDKIVRGELDGGKARDYVVDGSILAAKVIDASYSLFDRNENALANPGEVHYNGMFLGCEKIWVGEPVRLRVLSAPNVVPDMDVLIIHKMIERNLPSSTVTFIGDVYKFVEMPMNYKSRDQWPTNDHLPPRMVADLRFRNEVADNAKTGIWYEWRLLEPAARKNITDIKGRFYETRTLLPVMRGKQKFEEEVRGGKLQDAGLWMNGRRDNNKVPEERKKNRKDTLGRAVPAEFKVSRGLDGAAADNEFPDQVGVGAGPAGYVTGDLEYMDLDQGQEFYGV